MQRETFPRGNSGRFGSMSVVPSWEGYEILHPFWGAKLSASQQRKQRWYELVPASSIQEGIIMKLHSSEHLFAPLHHGNQSPPSGPPALWTILWVPMEGVTCVWITDTPNYSNFILYKGNNINSFNNVENSELSIELEYVTKWYRSML